MTMSQGTSHGSATQVIEAKDTTGRTLQGLLRETCLMSSLGKQRLAGFVVSEIITDKDSSMNAGIFLRALSPTVLTTVPRPCTRTCSK